MCSGNLALPCGRPFLRPLAPPTDGGWPAPAIRRAIETVMRVILQIQPYMDAQVAGINTLTHLVQLQTPDLQDSTRSLWAQGLLDSRKLLLLEHPSDTMGSCPKVMASMLEGRLLCVETCLRREMGSDGDKQKLELFQNMSARLLDMLSPPGWVRIEDVPIRQHKWLYCPLGHTHAHFSQSG